MTQKKAGLSKMRTSLRVIFATAFGAIGIIWMAANIGNDGRHSREQQVADNNEKRLTTLDERLLTAEVWNCHSYDWKGEYRFQSGVGKGREFGFLLRARSAAAPDAKDPDVLTLGIYQVDGTTIHLFSRELGADFGASTSPERANGQAISELGAHAVVVGDHIFLMVPNAKPTWNAIRVSELTKTSIRAQHVWSDPNAQPAEFEREFSCEPKNVEVPTLDASVSLSTWHAGTDNGDSSEVSERSIIDEYISSQAAESNGSEYEAARKVLKGDLSGDGIPDAVVLYTIEGMNGGNGSARYLAVFFQASGQLKLAADTTVGDFAVDKGEVVGGAILLHTLEFGPDDPRCCPSVRSTARYQLLEGNLTRE